ncbi:MAG: Ig-like domain repeat protein [Clostridia bacterium]|nr:Ig-like domain repeat protein [Clostridia bacterium]
MEVQAAATTLQQAINGLEAIPPAVTRTAIERDGTDGYRVYAQVETNGGAPIDRVQFPTWTDKNGQDDIQKNWENNSAASGTFGAWSVDGQQYNYMYYVDVCDHNIEYAGYNTHVYAYNVAGASAHAEADKVNFDYTVRFEGCGATGGSVAAQTVIYGESVTLPSVEREGYMFLGWAETANADAPQYQSGKTFKPSEDTTLYAVWGVAAPSVARDSKAIELAANGKAGNILGAQESNVWFGNYMQSSADSKEPVKWRVLENKDGKLFLFADQNLDVVRYNEERIGVTWADCTLRKWLNGYENHPYDDTFIGNAFTAKELTAVADSEVENANNPEYNANGGNDTTDKVFLLSIAEATNTGYGFTADYDYTDTRKATNTQYAANGGHTGVGTDNWWLRSPGRVGSYAAIVFYGGLLFCNGYYVSDHVAVRPAFKMNLNSVLFTSAAENGKQGDGLTAVGSYDGSDWKLTLLDNSRADFTASCTKDENGVRTITYSGAQTGENEMISAVIVDADGIVTYYGALENAKAGENTVTVNVNGKLQSGDKLYVFNEQVNGDKKTDYASALVDVTEKALTKYDLWVGGVQFDENNLEINANDIPGVTGSATYDPENNKLTLDDFQYTGEGYRYLVDPGTQNEHLNTAGIYYDGTDDLTVRLVQENAVTVTGDATSSDAFCSENLRTAVTFTGTGSLTARGADNAQDVSSGITVSGSLCVEKQATVTGVGGDSSDSSSYGVLAYVPNTKLEVYGKLTGNGGSASSRSCGVYGMEITVGTDAVLTAAGSAAGNTSEGIVAASVTVRSGTVEAASGKGERYSLAFKAKTGDNIAFDLSDDLTMRAGESKDKNETVTGDGWKNQKYVLIGEPATFSVTVTAGEGMTKTADSGDASQTVEAGSAMTDVVYTANDGYYFPEDYATEPVNGVSVTRDSFTQITVSGTPTGDAAITLPSPTAKGAPDMTVSADEVVAGEDAVITAMLPDDATGTVTFTIMEIREGGNVEAKKIENVPLEDAVAKASTAALPAGKYQVIADYSGDYKYTAATEQGDFVIRSRDGSITIALDKTKINVGESAVLSVVIPTDAGVIPGSGGNVTVKLNGTELQTITAENGKGNFTISSLHAGVYEVSAVFNGDGLYGAATSNLVHLVVVGTTELALEVWPGSEIEYGEPIIITATLSGDGDPVFAADDHVPVDDNDAALGGVTITVDGKTYYTVPANPGDPAITIDGNVARIQLPAPDAGLHYTVEANYRGDATHPAAKAEAGFTVRKSRTHIEVEYTESILAGETQTIKIILNSPLATGNVTVTLNGTQTNLELKNGSAFFETPPLPAGNYDLEVTYPANDNFEGAGKSVSFEVVSRDSGMTAALTDAAGTPLDDSTVAYGETAYVLATLPDDATGAVTFSLDGNTVEPTDDNPLLCALAGLSTGDHSVKVDFAGDDRYNKATVTVTFTVVCDHVWNEPEWNWENVANPSYSTTCSICEDAAEGNVPSTAGERVAATTETDAYTPYTATVILDGQEFIGKHNVVEPGTSLEFCKETFNAHKDALIDEADKKALEGDSDEAATLIENAEKAINNVEYDETKTYQDNIDALDDAVDFDQLDKDLTDQRAADAVEDKIDAIGEVEYTDESKQKIDDAREAYDALTDEQKNLVDNLDTLTDAEEKYEQLDNHAQFDDYKEAQKKAAGDKAIDGDSDECKQLIDDAIDAINDVTYDETKSLEDNKKAIDAAANLAQLDADLAEHRAIHYAAFYADGTLVENVPYTIDTKSITEPAVPEKVGHTGAWPDYTLKVGGTQIDAVYTPNPQTVNFDPNGGEGEMESVNTTWGSKVTLPECAFTAPNGKEFDKWDAGDPGDEIEVKSDLTVHAVWKEKPLTLTADVDPTQTGERIAIRVPYAKHGAIAATLTASEEGVRYESSKPGVISVDENGVIRLEKLCLFCKTATITAYSASGEKVASCVVNVRHAWWQYIIWFFFGSFWF